jgi:hypothetical protein
MCLNQLVLISSFVTQILQAHYIPNRAMFTNCVSHNEGAQNAKGQPVTFRKPSGYNGRSRLLRDKLNYNDNLQRISVPVYFYIFMLSKI